MKAADSQPVNPKPVRRKPVRRAQGDPKLVDPKLVESKLVESRSVDSRLANPEADPIRIGFVTLGCPKNLVDSETMLGGLNRAGFRFTSALEEAELVVVNTCAFLTASQKESIETILEVARLKETGRLRNLVVTGCLPQRHGASVLEEIPEIDYLLGPGTIDELTGVVRGLVSGDLKRGASLGGLDRVEVEWQPRVLSSHRHAAYLKISEGCNNTCSFCIIPQLRGKHRSRPIEDIENEAVRLASLGVRELTLVAQDTTSYGLDLYGHFSLDRLLERLDTVEGIRWIRLLYTYPRYWTDSLVECFAKLHRLVPYVDMPIQHASDPVLRRMRRGANWTKTEGWLRKLRAAVPGMVLRTTVITGFPGETEEDLDFLMQKMVEVEFDHLGVFPYSDEEGTPAAGLSGSVPEEVRQERRDRVLSLQRVVSLRRNRNRIGTVQDVMIDHRGAGGADAEGALQDDAVREDTGRLADTNMAGPRAGAIARGRWRGQALEIDGGVVIHGPNPEGLNPGDVVRVRIQGAGPYDLVGFLEEDSWS